MGLPTSACSGVCLELFEAVADRFPNVTLNIVEAMTGYLDEWIQSGRLDVALVYNQKAHEHVAWTEMMVEELVLLVPPTSEVARRSSISFRELSSLLLTLPASPNVLRVMIDYIAAKNKTTLNITDCNSLYGMFRLMTTGRMTILPRFAFAEDIEAGRLIVVPIVDPTPSWRLSVVLSQRTVNNRASEAVARVLADVINNMVESGRWMAKTTDRAFDGVS